MDAKHYFICNLRTRLKRLQVMRRLSGRYISGKECRCLGIRFKSGLSATQPARCHHASNKYAHENDEEKISPVDGVVERVACRRCSFIYCLLQTGACRLLWTVRGGACFLRPCFNVLSRRPGTNKRETSSRKKKEGKRETKAHRRT